MKKEKTTALSLMFGIVSNMYVCMFRRNLIHSSEKKRGR
jgi:hypothetical protein